MLLERIYTPGLAQIAYLVGDENAGVAAVIDPRRDVAIYLEAAQAANLRITHVFETHVHADFVSGARELAAATGATVYASRLGATEFAHTPVDDGDEVCVGALRFTALLTPGHTPEHLAFMLTDLTNGQQPSALFSGDVLFVGEVGRPDLLGAAHTDTLVSQLYDSIFERLSLLPDDLIVYPGHGAGSSCGKRIGDATTTTIGQEKNGNYAFQPRDRAAFAAALMTDMPPAPTYYPTLKRINKVGPTLLADLPDGSSLTPDEVAALVEDGALVIDAREADAFCAGHLPGALFAGLGPDFVAWVGWLAPYDRPLILTLSDDADYSTALTELRRIGLDRVDGFVAGGVAAWQASGRPLETQALIDAPELHERLASDAVRVLDVRSADEWRGDHIPAAEHRFAGEFARNWDAAPSAPNGLPLALICGSGYRSTVVASVLARAGRHDVLNVRGGMDAWRAAELEVTS